MQILHIKGATQFYIACLGLFNIWVALNFFFHMKDACRLFPKGDGFFFVGMIKRTFSVKADIGITYYMFYVLKTKPNFYS